MNKIVGFLKIVLLTGIFLIAVSIFTSIDLSGESTDLSEDSIVVGQAIWNDVSYEVGEVSSLCEDTDGGILFEIPAHVYYGSSVLTRTDNIDTCLDRNILLEYYCEDDVVHKIEYDCRESGQGCNQKGENIPGFCH